MAEPHKAEQHGMKQAAGDRPLTRRRGAALEEALLDAAWDELQASGYAHFTMDGVAERAGTSRAVLYRRWRNRPELVVAALRKHRPMLSGAVPDTGNLRDDVLAVLQRVSDQMTAVGPETIYGLVGDYIADADLFAALREQVLHVAADVMATILKRAEARGEARGDISPRIATLPTDLLRHELLLNRTPPTERTIVEIIDDVFLPLVQA